MPEPTAKHREEARELVRAWLLMSNPHHLIDHKDNLIERVAGGLSSRDREIREVLEGLSNGTNPACWCQPNVTGGHEDACLAARALWARVQG